MRVQFCPVCAKRLVYEDEHRTVCPVCGIRFNVYDAEGEKGIIICPEYKKEN